MYFKCINVAFLGIKLCLHNSLEAGVINELKYLLIPEFFWSCVL